MNQFAQAKMQREAYDASRGSAGSDGGPLGSAVAAVERCLAQAHEAGDADSLRLLHAVLALLTAAPSGRPGTALGR